MSRRKSKPDATGKRRHYPDDFKEDAVRMLFDGHSAQSVADRLGLSGTQMLYRWKKQMMAKIGPVADSLDTRVQELERELRRVERERDILKKALAIFGRHE
jgi:transposase